MISSNLTRAREEVRQLGITWWSFEVESLCCLKRSTARRERGASVTFLACCAKIHDWSISGIMLYTSPSRRHFDFYEISKQYAIRKITRSKCLIKWFFCERDLRARAIASWKCDSSSLSNSKKKMRVWAQFRCRFLSRRCRGALNKQLNGMEISFELFIRNCWILYCTNSWRWRWFELKSTLSARVFG